MTEVIFARNTGNICNCRDRNGEEASGAHFHPVLVLDNTVRHYIQRCQLKKNDKILVQGHIGYKPFIDTRLIQTGFIFANNIYRIARIPSIDESQRNESEKVNRNEKLSLHEKLNLASRHFEGDFSIFMHLILL